jgi:hypothetical protein
LHTGSDNNKNINIKLLFQDYKNIIAIQALKKPGANYE